MAKFPSGSAGLDLAALFMGFRGRQRAESNHDAAHEEETGEGEKGIEGYIHL
jgi:hypothetical protein